MTSNNDPAYSKILHASWHVKEWEGLKKDTGYLEKSGETKWRGK